jgi:hypothetical protein
MSGKVVLQNVRRYRTIALLYRQTAAFRPDQKWSLLSHAFEYERLARPELDTRRGVLPSKKMSLLTCAGSRHDRSDDRATLDGLMYSRLSPGFALATVPAWVVDGRSDELVQTATAADEPCDRR